MNSLFFMLLSLSIPFEVRLPYENPVCMESLNEEGLNAELEKGGYVVMRGRVPIAYFNDKCYGGSANAGQ